MHFLPEMQKLYGISWGNHLSMKCFPFLVFINKQFKAVCHMSYASTKILKVFVAVLNLV